MAPLHRRRIVLEEARPSDDDLADMTSTMLLRWQSTICKPLPARITSTDALSFPSVDLSEVAPTVEEADRRSADTAGLLSLFGRVFVIGSRKWFE